MKIEPGEYRTRDGKKAQVFIQQNYNVLGAIWNGNMWIPCQWYNCGHRTLKDGCDDLIGLWEEPKDKDAIVAERDARIKELEEEKEAILKNNRTLIDQRARLMQEVARLWKLVEGMQKDVPEDCEKVFREHMEELFA